MITAKLTMVSGGARTGSTVRRFISAMASMLRQAAPVFMRRVEASSRTPGSGTFHAGYSARLFDVAIGEQPGQMAAGVLSVAELVREEPFDKTRVRGNLMFIEILAHEPDYLPVLFAELNFLLPREHQGDVVIPVRGVIKLAFRVRRNYFSIDLN